MVHRVFFRETHTKKSKASAAVTHDFLNLGTRQHAGNTRRVNALREQQASISLSPPSHVPTGARQTKALKIRSPDSRIHVYGSDKDCVESYDWGPDGRFPTAHFWDPDVRKGVVRMGVKVPGFR